MNDIFYKLALARRDDLLREASNHRRANEGAASPRFAHLRFRIRRPAPRSPLEGRRAAAQSET